MIRAVLAVVLSVALVGASLPAIEDVRRERATADVERQVDRLETAARTLLRTEDATRGPGARRTMTVVLPERTWSRASISSLHVRELQRARGLAISWQVAGAGNRSRLVAGLPLALASNGSVRLGGPGRHRTVLALQRRDGRRVVTIRRFKRGDGTTPSRDSNAAGRHDRRGLSLRADVGGRNARPRGRRLFRGR